MDRGAVESVRLVQEGERALDIPKLMLASAHMHPREAIQFLTHAVLEAVDRDLRDDATSLCFDWSRLPAGRSHLARRGRAPGATRRALSRGP
jgi:hypothetical protein